MINNYNIFGIDNRLYVNCTPHTLNMINEKGRRFNIPHNPKFIISAEPLTSPADSPFSGIDLVKTDFVMNEELVEELIILRNKGVVCIGSIIACQAYKGLIFGLIPEVGYERKPPEEKLMKSYIFNSY